MHAEWELAVDNRQRLLHLGGRIFPCDRDVEALAAWQDHALLLSSDTDCLSLWDAEGLVRLTRVGVYPQDMAVQDDCAFVCGGADGMVHALRLPGLIAAMDYPVPGMPERICLGEGHAHLLTLLTDAEVQTALLHLNLRSGEFQEIARYPGIPGALAENAAGLWVGVSELLCHLPIGAETPDMVIEGFSLPQRIRLEADSVLVSDPLEGLTVRISQFPRATVEVLRRDSPDDLLFSR